ncbi:hypothetical protein [Scytonema sp. NUACC21]
MIKNEQQYQKTKEWLRKFEPDFSREKGKPLSNLSPTRREALISPPSLVGKGAGGLGFPHDVKSQI